MLELAESSASSRTGFFVMICVCVCLHAARSFHRLSRKVVERSLQVVPHSMTEATSDGVTTATHALLQELALAEADLAKEQREVADGQERVSADEQSAAARAAAAALTAPSSRLPARRALQSTPGRTRRAQYTTCRPPSRSRCRGTKPRLRVHRSHATRAGRQMRRR